MLFKDLWMKNMYSEYGLDIVEEIIRHTLRFKQFSAGRKSTLIPRYINLCDE